MKKILVIENIHFQSIYGGIPIYARNVRAANKENRIDILGTGQGDKDKSGDNISLSSEKVGHIKYYLLVLLYTLKQRKTLVTYDIIHYHRPDVASISLLLSLYKKFRVYCTFHGNHFNSIKSKKGALHVFLYRVMSTIGLNLIDVGIFVEARYKGILKTKESIIKVIPTGLDISGISNPVGSKENRRFFLYVGRLEKEKNVRFIIQEFLASKKLGDKLFIVGDGNQREELEKIASDSAIVFEGAKFGDDLNDSFKKSNCLLLASEFEASPTVVREALYFSLNIISLDVGDVKEHFSYLNEKVQIVSKSNFRKCIEEFEYKPYKPGDIDLSSIDSNMLYKNYYDA